MNNKGREGDRKQIPQLFESRQVNSKLSHMRHHHILRTHTVYDVCMMNVNQITNSMG